MPQGDGEQYLEPEHHQALQDLRKGGLTYRLDPGVTFFSIDEIERRVKAMCAARARRLGSDVFVPAGAKRGWEVRAVATMASDARAVAAWRRDRGEAVEDEDEEEA
ncbi:unnamed protein product, partial [Pelagomonas calceolata]